MIFKKQLAILLTALMLTVGACSSVNQSSTPATFNSNLAIATTTVTSAYQTLDTLVLSGKISKTQATSIKKDIDTANSGVDVARSLSGTDMTSASNRLSTITTLLTAVMAELNKQGAK